MMRRLIQRTGYWAVVAALVAVVPVGMARADTIFTDLGSGGTFTGTGGYVLGGANDDGDTLAMPFQVGAAADLAAAILALGSFGGRNDAIQVYLESDSSSGLPGTVLATLTQQGTIPPTNAPTLVTFYCNAGCPLLSSGASYWLVAVTDSSSPDVWFLSNSDRGTFALNPSYSASGPWDTESGTLSAFKVDGTPAAVPEPSSLVLLGIALCGFAVVGRRLRLTI
ncbi:MAG TPA: PEP-CTERM sorting domain-containing protein [Terriglobia bacterium]|nr:PEP-CTERM sorting domain-containing protein [Terriglobia bacterium]